MGTPNESSHMPLSNPPNGWYRRTEIWRTRIHPVTAFKETVQPECDIVTLEMAATGYHICCHIVEEDVWLQGPHIESVDQAMTDYAAFIREMLNNAKADLDAHIREKYEEN